MEQNKIIVFVGRISHQHIVNFVRSLKLYNPFDFWGIDLTGDQTVPDGFERVFYVKTSRFFIVNQIRRLILPAYYVFRIRKNVSVIQFHGFSVYAFIAIPLARILGIKVSYFIWGSDLLRANRLQNIINSVVYRSASSIVCDSSTVIDYFKNKFSKYAGKLELCYFGSPVIDRLSKLQENRNTNNSHFIIPDNRIVIMCGYNGWREQNHLKIFNSLKNYKDRLYLIVPMTYGGTKEYAKEVDSFLANNGFTYSVINNFLSEEEWCRIELSTNIFIHMQVSDAFSSSIAEHLFLGNIVINANWIIYPDLINNGVYYLSADFTDLSSVFEKVINNYDNYLTPHSSNHEKILSLKSLDFCVKNYWTPYYRRLLE